MSHVSSVTANMSALRVSTRHSGFGFGVSKGIRFFVRLSEGVLAVGYDLRNPIRLGVEVVSIGGSRARGSSQGSRRKATLNCKVGLAGRIKTMHGKHTGKQAAKQAGSRQAGKQASRLCTLFTPIIASPGVPDITSTPVTIVAQGL